MNDKLNEEHKDLEKLNEAFLYDIGSEYAKLICEEADELMEEYKDLEVPKSMDQRFYSILKKLETRVRKKQRRKKFLQYTKRVAVVLLVISVGLSALTIGSDAFRLQFYNVLIDTKEIFGLVTYEEEIHENKAAPDNWTGYYPSYIPDEYTLIESEAGTAVSILRYVNKNGEILEFIQGTISLTSQNDTEDATVIEVEINGESGITTKKGDVTIVGWSKNGISFMLQGNLDKSTLIEIAKKIIEI